MSIDNDKNFNYFGNFISNPQNTLFKGIYTKFTHYRRWIDKLFGDTKEGIIIFDINQNDISLICNATINLSFSLNIDFKEIFNMINNITFKIGQTDLINMNGLTFFEILKLDKLLFNKIYDIYKNKKKLMLPIQIILSYMPLTLCSLETNISISISINNNIQFKEDKEYIYIKDYNLEFENFKLTEEELNRYKYCCNEFIINGYFVEKYDINNKIDNKLIIPIDCQLPIENIIITSDSELKEVLFEHINFKRSDDDFLELYDNIRHYEDHNYTYYLRSEAFFIKNIPGLNGKNLYDLSGLFYPHKDTKLIIKSDTNVQINIIYIYRNFLLLEEKASIKFNFKKKQVAEINYPLTKINDNTFIEGYWKLDKQFIDESAPNYPFPKSTNEEVDKLFIDTVKTLMIKTYKKEFFGSSFCRICQCKNGSGEYELEKNNIKFIFPEGLIHYYIEHHVQPSKEFYDFILSMKIKNTFS